MSQPGKGDDYTSSPGCNYSPCYLTLVHIQTIPETTFKLINFSPRFFKIPRKTQNEVSFLQYPIGGLSETCCGVSMDHTLRIHGIDQEERTGLRSYPLPHKTFSCPLAGRKLVSSRGNLSHHNLRTKLTLQTGRSKRYLLGQIQSSLHQFFQVLGNPATPICLSILSGFFQATRAELSI